MSNIEKFKFQNIPSTKDGGLVIDADVRVMTIGDEPWFVASDVVSILGLTNTAVALDRVDVEDKQTIRRSEGVSFGDTFDPRVNAVSLINESGLYALIFQSYKPQAKAFKKWVTSVVLPTIRKTGGYIEPAVDLSDPDVAIEKIMEIAKVAKEARAALAASEAANAALEAKVEADAPFVKAAEEFFDMEGLYSLRDAARKFGIPPLKFNDILRGWGWIDERGTAAKAYAVRMEYAKNRNYIHPGSGAATTQGRLTNKGLERAAVKLKEQGVWVSYTG